MEPLVRNSFQRQPLRLLEEQERRNRDDDIEHTPEKERAPAQIRDHVGCGQGEDEVEKPLRADPDGDAGFSDACRENPVVDM